MLKSSFTVLLSIFLGLTGLTLLAQPSIDAVYFAQTHVSKTSDPYIVLVSDRELLIKVHVTEPGAVAAPEVRATLSLAGNSTFVILTGPAVLPTSIPDGPGIVQHDINAGFSGFIPFDWVKPGLEVTVTAGTATPVVETPTIGAPNHLVMQMIDVHYFKADSGDYPAGTIDELTAKWPVASVTLNRFSKVVFPELVIPTRGGKPATRCNSKEDYTAKTGLTFDGEQSAATKWNRALRDAGGGYGYRVLSYINIYGVFSGGVAGGFGGVGNGKKHGILHHELGHAFSLPHWGDSASYPYKGAMHGINPPGIYNETHAGPTWAYDLPSKTFIPPTVQVDQVGSYPLDTYKADPMQGGGTGYQEQGFLLNHFSDYSLYKINNTIQSNMIVWNSALNEWTKWNATDKDYTNVVSNDGVKLPVQRDVEVISVLASISGATPQANMVYAPIGPYTAGLIKRFDPRVPADCTEAQAIFAPGTGCDITLRIIQGGTEAYYMLAASWEPEKDPLTDAALWTKAVNLPASGGEVTFVEMLLTPDAEDKAGVLPASPESLYTWDLGDLGKITNLQAHNMPTGIYLEWKNNWEYTAIEVWRNGLLLASLGPSATSYLDTNPLASGDATYSLVAVRNGFEFDPAEVTLNMDTVPDAALIYEPFEDIDATLTGNVPGTGLTGSWYTRGINKGNGSQGVLPVSLSYGNLTTYAGKTIGYESGGWPKSSYVSTNHMLDTAGLLSDGNVLWFSVLVQNGTSSYVDFRIGTDGIYEGGGGEYQGEAIGVSVDGDLVTAATWNPDPPSGTLGGVIPLSTPVLVVGKLTWAANSLDADTVDIYLPGTDLMLPASAASTASAVLDQSLFDTLCFRGDGEDAPHLDEIRFGASYDAVIAAEDIAPDLISPATATPAFFTVGGSTTLSVAVQDPIGRSLTYQWTKVSGPAGPSFATANATDTVVNGFSTAGNYDFEVLVSNGPQSLTSAITVSVTSIGNTAPVASDQAVSTGVNKAQNIILQGSDAEDDALIFLITSQPSNGTLSGGPETVTYTPNEGYSGNDSFTFTVNDGEVDSNEATVSIRVVAATGGGGGGGGCSVSQPGTGMDWLAMLLLVAFFSCSRVYRRAVKH